MAALEENKPNQPMQTPPAVAPVEGGGIEDGDYLENPAVGCLGAVVLSVLVFLFIGIPSGSPGGWVIAFNASGPVSGLLLWLLFRGSRLRFARGALVFAIIAFAVVGTCWIAAPLSSENGH